MFQNTAVYRKSSAGQEALARRDPALTMRHRSLLILIDGKRQVEELGRLAAGAGEFESLMADLSQLGMIEAVAAPLQRAGTAQASPAPSSAAAPDGAPPASGDAHALTLAQAQRIAVRRLTDLLGPSAEDICMKLESARTPQEFLAQVKRADDRLRAVRGAAAADSFAQAVAGYRPA